MARPPIHVDPALRPATLEPRPIRLGELLVEAGVMTPEQVRHVLNVQRQVSRPFGDLAERLFNVDPHLISGAWAEQYVQRHGIRDLSDARPDPAWAGVVSARQAWQFRIVPLHTEAGMLLVATEPLALARAANFCGQMIQEPVSLIVTDPGSLRLLLMRSYPVGAHLARHAEDHLARKRPA